MASENALLGKVAASYLASLPLEGRAAAQPEIDRFVRWYGADRPINKLAPPDLEAYTQAIEASGAPPAQRLDPVRALLTFARKEGHLSENLAPHVRIRRQLVRKTQTVNPLSDDFTIEMTAEGHARLQAELAELINERPKIAEELARARADKDFRENAPLDAARERQAMVEARIRELEATLKHAVIVSGQSRSGNTRAAIGSTVVVRDLENDDVLEFTLVSPSEVDLKSGRISVASPLGRALLDHEPGDEVPVEAPAGILHYRIEEVRD